MTTLLHVLGYVIPWWIWGLFGLAAVVLLARFAGVRAALAAGAALVLALAQRRGAQRGYAHAIEEGEENARKSLDAARGARDAALARDGDARRLRDDDGFRRD
ncbi:hypothetical protein EZH22_17005 [Xanthobacter dioxanivorans]|uniref:Uncharacterized protein n=1 Tax=Xanthobacter dioxanivorans TaxID=2528964 RepID=A0A974PJN1_9HYPH|nr:hypothetical protein [Xanthobacter dioxanivorans]QRG04847.1 hypothetical protein EZH22_17005 [Xanthobacter dioxanivorans]